MVIVKKMHVKQFRGIIEKELVFNRPVNAIIGKNGTMKTTVLGMLAHPFTLKTGVMAGESPLTGGRYFNSPMRDKFKFSPEHDLPGQHEWSLTVNKQVYEKEIYTCVSEKRSDTGKLRFWSTEGRGKDMNAIQCPVIYLSMKRLTPIGEEKSLKVESAQLTDEEKRFYCEKHNEILICTENIKDVSSVHSSGKNTLGARTETYDAWTISAGQDNVGRIILAVLSMIRLKNKYPNDYKGGIICIDEVESTLYPAAQEKLIEFMYDSAEKYKLQFFFTTHSMSVIKYLKLGKYNNRNSITYLQRINGKILVHSNPSLKDIENNLNVEAGKEAIDFKIRVYCEDDTGILFCKSFLKSDIKKRLSFITGMDLSWTVYRTLYNQKVPEFLDNIIVLDGDVKRTNRGEGWRNYPKGKNIVYFPTMVAPETMIYEMLYELDEEDPFWDNHLSGYSRDVCFRNYPNHLESIDDIKTWLKEQKDYAGKGYCRFLTLWKKKHPEEVATFSQDFINAYNYVAKRVGFDEI